MKKGFTLAEVLITLGIIGVVAALTAPALIQNTGTAKVGPTLAKAVSTLELANQNMLNATESVSIKTSPIGSNIDNAYLVGMSDYMKTSPFTDSGTLYKDMLKNYDGSNVSGGPNLRRGITTSMIRSMYAMTKDGLLYTVWLNGANDTNLPVNRQIAGVVLIDINGKAKPNRAGKDAFLFYMMQDGTLKPVGGNMWSSSNDDNESFNWQNGTTDKCNEEEVTTGWTCAGSIYENNLKVIYQ